MTDDGLRSDADMDAEAPDELLRLQDENHRLRTALDDCIGARDALSDDYESLAAVHPPEDDDWDEMTEGEKRALAARAKPDPDIGPNGEGRPSMADDLAASPSSDTRGAGRGW